MSTIRLERAVDAPPAIAWEVLTDHELYADAAPNLASVEVIEGEAESMVRRCIDTDGNAWTERCTWWDEGRAFAVSVDVEGSDFHRRLFSRFEGEWLVEEGPDGVTLVIQFDFEPRFGPLGRVIAVYFAYRAPDIVERIFDRWEAELDARVGSQRPEADRRTDARAP